MREKTTSSLEWNIINRCMKGDHDAFKELYEKYKDRVFSTSVRIVGNLQDAEDIFQDIFIKVFNNINKFKGKSSFATWIYKITINTCIDHKRKLEKFRNNSDIHFHTDRWPASSPNKCAGDFRLMAEKEIEALPEGYKTVFILHAIEGFKHREIAEILGISTGTSKSQFFQAKSLLRKKLLPYHEVLKNEL